MTNLFANQPERAAFTPTRAAGLKRLEQFVTRTGRHYAKLRNYDFGPTHRNNVSMLSPWLRHRLITEEEVLSRVLASHSESAAEKFIQEVFWRSYFKGWLEQRPSVWTSYQRNLISSLEHLDRDTDLRSAYADAVEGRSGIECFDHWATELIETGYLHNHARMWMASIWTFTLRLPWVLGADFFLRHLLDGDPASNTLSWRWVAGLHTKGKTYLARPENIAKYTEGRFQPSGLATVAEPVVESDDHPRDPLTTAHTYTKEPYLLLLTEDDLSASRLLDVEPAETLGLLATHGRSPQPVQDRVVTFSRDAMQSALAPLNGASQTADDWSKPLTDAAEHAGVRTIVTAHAPIGPARTRLDSAEPKLRAAGLSLCRILRPYDQIVWPHAKAGFFGLKKKIPNILRDLDLNPGSSKDLI